MKKTNRNKQNSSKGKGWPERKQLIVTKKGIEHKAPKHYYVAIKNEADNARNIPIPTKQRRTIAIPAGWQNTPKGYSYEKTISQARTLNRITKKILRGYVIANHAILSLYTYTKDAAKLTELEEKEQLLDAKLNSYVISHPEYPETLNELVKTKELIKAIKQDIGAGVETDRLLEDWYSGDLGSDDHIEWQKKFMQKALIKAEQSQRSALSEPKVNSVSQKSTQENYIVEAFS